MSVSFNPTAESAWIIDPVNRNRAVNLAYVVDVIFEPSGVGVKALVTQSNGHTIAFHGDEAKLLRDYIDGHRVAGPQLA